MQIAPEGWEWESDSLPADRDDILLEPSQEFEARQLTIRIAQVFS